MQMIPAATTRTLCLSGMTEVSHLTQFRCSIMKDMDGLKNSPAPSKIASLTVSAFVMLGLTLSGCTSASNQSREASSLLDVEVCFTNELAIMPAEVSTTEDGSGTLWQTTLRPGQTGCTHTKNSTAELQGFITVSNLPEEFAYRFNNPSIGYPEGALISRPVGATTKSGQGVCQGFSAGESVVLDSGSARLFAERKTDSQFKRFKVVVMPSEAKTAMKSCSVSPTGHGANG